MKYAIRVLGREKAFAAFAVLTLALGIGAVTAIFSIVDSVLLKPLAYKDPGRLYAASESVAKFAHVYPDLPVNGSHFWSWQKQCQAVPMRDIRDFPLIIAAMRRRGYSEERIRKIML
jgi:hypothetical protein